MPMLKYKLHYINIDHNDTFQKCFSLLSNILRNLSSNHLFIRTEIRKENAINANLYIYIWEITL